MGVMALALCATAVAVFAQFAVPRPLNVPVVCGTGLQAISTVGSNNWTQKGPFGGLGGGEVAALAGCCGGGSHAATLPKSP